MHAKHIVTFLGVVVASSCLVNCGDEEEGPGCGDGVEALKEATSVQDCPTTYCFTANGATCVGCGNAVSECH
jgi:hypothetical protein